MSKITRLLYSLYYALTSSRDVLFSFERPFLLWLRIGIAVIIFLAFYLLRKFLTHKVENLLRRFTKKTKNKFDDCLLEAFESPLRLLFITLGIYFALRYLPLNPITDLYINKIFRSVLVFLVALGFYNLAGTASIMSPKTASFLNIKVDKILLPFLSKVIRFIIIVLAVVVILQEWEYDITGFITGIGLGGLAFALAAQQTLANLFGGIVIITDKPFTIGDWILTPSVEGTVEDINFRSTKVRTFAQALVTVPNSTLANEPITNWSRMGKRQISFKMGVPYSTPKDKLESCIKKIKTMLQNHQEIHDETIMVGFDSFADGRYNIFLYFFTKTTKWAEFVQVKEDINLQIISILEEEGVYLTPPSSQILLPKTSSLTK